MVDSRHFSRDVVSRKTCRLAVLPFALYPAPLSGGRRRRREEREEGSFFSPQERGEGERTKLSTQQPFLGGGRIQISGEKRTKNAFSTWANKKNRERIRKTSLLHQKENQPTLGGRRGPSSFILEAECFHFCPLLASFPPREDKTPSSLFFIRGEEG